MSRALAQFVTLSTNARMPTIGLGTWQSTPEQVRDAVKAAVDAGYRHIDTAWAYRNEKDIGIALKECFDEGKVKREEMFITTKLHAYFHRKEDVLWAVKDSLENLQLAYLDLFLVHGPCPLEKTEGTIFPVNEKGELVADSVDHLETWKGMESAYIKGLTKAIGLSNFNHVQIQRIVDNCSIKPHNLQVECNGYWPQVELKKFCDDNGITFTAYAPIGSPGHANFNISRYGKDGAENADAREDGAEKTPPPKILMQEPIVTSIAEKHNKTAAQVLLRWLVQRGIVAIPKSVTPARIHSNFQMWDFELSEDEMKKLSSLTYKRAFDMPPAKNHPEYPFSIPY